MPPNREDLERTGVLNRVLARALELLSAETHREVIEHEKGPRRVSPFFCARWR